MKIIVKGRVFSKRDKHILSSNLLITIDKYTKDLKDNNLYLSIDDEKIDLPLDDLYLYSKYTGVYLSRKF